MAALNTIQTKFRNKLYYDKRENTTHFKEGDMVYLINEANLPKISKDAFIGPFEITGLGYDSHAAEIQTQNYKKIVNFNKLKHACEVVTGRNRLVKPTPEILKAVESIM